MDFWSSVYHHEVFHCIDVKGKVETKEKRVILAMVGSVLTICATTMSTIIIDSLSSLGFGFLPDILSQKCMVIWQTHSSIFLRSKFRRNIDNPYCIRWHFGSLWPGKWLNISNNANTSKSAVCLLTSSKQRPRFTMRLSWCLKHSCPCSQSLSIRQVFRRFLGSIIESFFHG